MVASIFVKEVVIASMTKIRLMQEGRYQKLVSEPRISSKRGPGSFMASNAACALQLSDRQGALASPARYGTRLNQHGLSSVVAAQDGHQ